MMMEIRVAAILRKSPTDKKAVDKSFDKQYNIIKARIKQDFPEQNVVIDVFQDIAKGDDDKARLQLHDLFSKLNSYNYAYALNVDRFSRCYLGLKYVYEYFLPSNCKLRFVEEESIYNNDGELDQERMFIFGIKCLVAQKELHNIRRRTKEGRERKKAEGGKLSQKNIVEKNPEIKRAAIKLRKKGLSYKNIAIELKIMFPNENFSSTRAYNTINKY